MVLKLKAHSQLKSRDVNSHRNMCFESLTRFMINFEYGKRI